MAWVTPTDVAPGDAILASLYNQDVVANTNALYQSIQRLAYIERNSNYTVDQATIAAAADVFSSDLTITADGTSAYLFKLWIPNLTSGSSSGAQVVVSFVNGSGTDLGIIANPDTKPSGAVQNHVSLHAEFYYTPSAGSQSFNIRARRNVSNGTLTAGAGGAATFLPMWFAIYGPAQT